MVAYSFKKRFEQPIQAGTKRQTMRNDRKRHARPGECLQLYVAMRTKQCRKILEADPVCSSVQPVRVEFGDWGRITEIKVGAIILRSAGRLDDFAQKDGFDDAEDMSAFWRQEHPEAVAVGRWEGVLIRWDPANVDQVLGEAA